MKRSERGISPNRSTRSNIVPFNDSPIQNSAAVVREAKLWSAYQAVNTERPNTPKDGRRSLFGSEPGKATSRPPSAFSIGSQHFDPSDPLSRPGSGVSSHPPPRLSPLDHKPTINKDALEVTVSPVKSGKFPKPPMINKTEIALKSQARSRLALRKHGIKQPSSPIKALPIGVGDMQRTPTPPKYIRESHSAGYVNTEVYADETENIKETNFENKSPDLNNQRAHSASTINVDLAKLINVDENADSRAAVSSSSSASSIDPDRLSGRSRSGGKGSGLGDNEEETAAQALYWNKNVLPLLENLEKLDINNEDLYQTSLNLYEVLENGGCITKMSSRRRTSLLSTLFKLLTKDSPSLLLACARIILAVKVRRRNLDSICKLIFKISRESKHDDLFLKHNLIDNMLNVVSSTSVALDKYEALVYLTGSFRFLCVNNESVVLEIIKHNGIKAFIHLNINLINSIKVRDCPKKAKTRAADILIQVTAVLRSLSDYERSQFENEDFFSSLSNGLRLLVFDEKLVLNISRLLSKLTMYSEILNAFFLSEWEPKFILNAVYQHMKNVDIITRLCFVIGNIATKNEDVRLDIFNAKRSKNQGDENWCMEILNRLFQKYLKSKIDNETAKLYGDVINKVIRVIANLSITEEIGESISHDETCINHMLTVLEVTNVDENEELVLNTLTTFNNLSYYNNLNSFVVKKRLKITHYLVNVIMANNMSCVTEAVRVFGNLTQFADIREFLHENKLDRFIVALLDSQKYHTVHSACGVLINMSSTQKNRPCLISEGIVDKIIDILKDMAPLEWRVGGVTCQLLWNLTDDISSNITSENIETIINILNVYLEENAPFTLLDTSSWDEEMREYIMSSWEADFVPFADRLLGKLMKHHSHLVPLENDA